MDGHDAEHSARAIENLIARYAELVDAGDFAGLGELLADAVFGGDGDAVVSGREEIEKIFRAMVHVYDDGTPRTKHVTTNIQIDVDAGVGNRHVTLVRDRAADASRPAAAAHRRRPVSRRFRVSWGCLAFRRKAVHHRSRR